MRKVRGSKIGFIFQDPMTSLNPLFTVEQQLKETIHANMKVSDDEAYQRALSLMQQVGIPQPENRLKQYPHQFLVVCVSVWLSRSLWLVSQI